jgi:hypothetical protein
MRRRLSDQQIATEITKRRRNLVPTMPIGIN